MAEIKEKCIYYDTNKDGYYLVLSISDRIYGRYGNLNNPTPFDNYMYQDEGLKFKIDDIIIVSDRIRNFNFDAKELNNFKFIRELTDEEFYPMKFLIHSNYKFTGIIDIHKHMKEVSDTVYQLWIKKSLVSKLEKEICDLEVKLYNSMK